VGSAKLEISADRASCATFSLDAQHRVVVAAEPGDAASAILDAARACPNFAIEVRRGEERLA
jgi:ferredoxin